MADKMPVPAHNKDHTMKSDRSAARLIAFYLPQFHPIPENDQWWGKGFTEWVIVSSARPLFRGHYQPRIPSELGFYDLRLPETRQAQAELAKNHGIEGFCYWHYWLGNGKRLLEKPFEDILNSDEPDFPFCLGWANHSWVGRYFASGGKLLLEQKYPGLSDFENHFYTLLRAFRDKRYIKVNGKPLFYVYAPRNVPNIRQVNELWRELAVKEGLKGLHLVGQNLPEDQYREYGFDAFSYSGKTLHNLIKSRRKFSQLIKEFYRRCFRKPLIVDYQKFIDRWEPRSQTSIDGYPFVLPSWDTTPRHGWRGEVLKNSTPEYFRLHLRDMISKVQHKPHDHRIIFIKSWNEWGEGNYLEPDRQFGKKYLEVVKEENQTRMN